MPAPPPPASNGAGGNAGNLGNSSLSKLSFKVVFCSSYDEEYHYKGLEHHGPQTRGWQSKRLSPFPQRLVLDFGEEVEVGKLQILAHQHKIPATIDLYADATLVDAPVETALAAANFQRLGYISLNSNEETRFQARELKTVYLQTRLRFLQLVIPGVHNNSLNVFKQAGIVAINVLGRPISSLRSQPQVGPEEALPYGQNQPRLQPQAPFAGVGGPGVLPPQQPLPNLGGPMADKLLAEIKRLQKLKEDAVAIEDYDEAKRFKLAGDRLKALASEITRLELEKKQCVETDDFDGAKACKLRLEKLYAEALKDPAELAAAAAQPVSQPQVQPVALSVPAHNSHTSPSGHFPRHLHNQQEPVAAPNVGGYSIPSARAITSPDDRPIRGAGAAAPRRESADGVPDAAPVPFDEQPIPKRNRPPVTAPEPEATSEEPQVVHIGSRFSSELDEVPVGQARAKRGTAPITAEDESFAGGLANMSSGDPEELTAVELKEAEPLIDAVGMQNVKLIYSKQPSHRQTGLRQVQEMLVNQQAPLMGPSRAVDSTAALAAVCRIIKMALDDTAVVAFAGLQLLEAAIPIFSSATEGLGGAVLTQHLEPTVPLLLKQISGSNARCKTAAHELLVLFTRHRAIDPNIVTTHALRPLQKREADKPLVLKGRAQLLLDILPRLGFVEGVKKQGQVQLAPVLKFALPCLQFRDAQVRDTASKVVALCVEHCGERTVKPYLKDLPTQSKELISSAIIAAGGASTIGDDAPAAAPGSSTPGPSTAAAASAASANKNAASSSKASAPAAPSSNRGAAGGAGRSTSPARQGQGPSVKESAPPVRETPGGKGSSNASRQAPASTASATAAAAAAAASAASAASAAAPADSADLPDVDPDGIAPEGSYCHFCGKDDQSLTINRNRDDHYCVSCPGLILCVGCSQVVEIVTLPEHWESECEERSKPEVIQLLLESAKKMQDALKNAPPELRNNALPCPLCYDLIPNTAAGALPGSSDEDYNTACRAWQTHFAQKPYCKANPRTQGM